MKSPHNAIVRYPLAAILNALASGTIDAIAPSAIVPVDLGTIGDVPLSFTDGAALPDGRMVFTTHRGHLYLIEPQTDRAARVTAVGWFHPARDTYSPSLFSLDGRRYLAGVTQRGDRFDWVTFDLQTRKPTVHPLDTKGLKDVLLYGSVSRDNAGRFYIGGWASDAAGGRKRPLLLQVGLAP